MENKNNIGKNIRERRLELKLTQEELAKKLGYKSRSSINKIELGINDISQKQISSFAKALQTTPSYLLGFYEEKNNLKIHYEPAVNYVILNYYGKERQEFLTDEQLETIDSLLNHYTKEKGKNTWT